MDTPDPIACEKCGVQDEIGWFGKRDVPYRDLPIHGKRVTLWVVRHRYTCRACKTTFRPRLPEMMDGFRMTLCKDFPVLYKKTIGYGLPDFTEELNYGVDLSAI